jgi:hypothetical protein
MYPNPTERRHMSLLNPPGDPLLSARIVHDRRRRKVVEDLMEAMRLRVRDTDPTPKQSKTPNPHAPIRRQFWQLIAIILLAFLMTMLLTRMSYHIPDLRSQPLGAGALYGWMGFHRVGVGTP